MRAQKEPLEINGDSSAPLEIPVPVFPPFKLRSSMVDTDPVIWVHLLEVYIHYVQTTLSLRVPLTDRSEQQLQAFVKSYLHEMAEERAEGQLLSLGEINVDITKNLQTLRAWMFELVRQFGLLKLKLDAEAVWDLCRAYALTNAETVRGLVDGSLNRPRVSSIAQLQRHLEDRITNGKWQRYDMQILNALLRGKPKKQQQQKGKQQQQRQKKSFADQFLTASWMETLERLYSNGEGRFATVCKDIAITSLVSVSVNRIATVAAELGINTYHSLGLYPLFAGIITNAQFHKINSGLEQKLPFIRPRATVNQDDVQQLIDMFPTPTIAHTESLLRKHKTVEKVTMLLLENPDTAVPKEPKSTVPSADSIISKKVINKRRTTPQVTNEAKNKTMQAALRMLNGEDEDVPDAEKNKTLTHRLRLIKADDEDEYDDTYDDAEATAGVEQSKEQTKYDKIERYLWDLFKTDPASFEQKSRKSNKRKEMKATTTWSDEQIEGWARMIQKSPNRARLLEEKYMFRGNKPERSPFYNAEQDVDLKQERLDAKAPQSKKGGPPTKKQQARNEKNKASRANHNRKSGHDKKMAKGFN